MSASGNVNVALSSLRFLFMAKGGGSANKTYLYQQTKVRHFAVAKGDLLFRPC